MVLKEPLEEFGVSLDDAPSRISAVSTIVETQNARGFSIGCKRFGIRKVRIDTDSRFVVQLSVRFNFQEVILARGWVRSDFTAQNCPCETEGRQIQHSKSQFSNRIDCVPVSFLELSIQNTTVTSEKKPPSKFSNRIGSVAIPSCRIVVFPPDQFPNRIVVFPWQLWFSKRFWNSLDLMRLTCEQMMTVPHKFRIRNQNLQLSFVYNTELNFAWIHHAQKSHK